MFKVVIIVLMVLILRTATAAGPLADGLRAYEAGDYDRAYRLLLPLASEATPRLLNFVGFMLYYGQGVVRSSELAHEFFHRAAELGIADAQQNLGILHSQGTAEMPVDYEEAVYWFTKASISRIDGEDPFSNELDQQLPNQFETVIRTDAASTESGKKVFLTFCAGCHGFNGFAFFPAAPSFAMGERIVKDDGELINSILKGKNLMPSWEDKLPRTDLESALKYLRTLAIKSGFGLLPIEDVEKPDTFYIFDPMGSNPGTNSWYQDVFE